MSQELPKGVNQCKDGRYRAYLSKDGQRVYLGRFDTAEEAIRARRDGETVYGTPLVGRIRPKSRILLDREVAFVEIISPKAPDAWAIIDVEDAPKVYNVRWRLWGTHVYNKIGYIHRIILDAKGNPLDIDHIDRNPLNNRKQNLRLCTRSANLHNQDPLIKSVSGVIGVSFDRSTGRWLAQITVDKKRHNLGRFKTKEEAAKARRDAEKRLGVAV